MSQKRNPLISAISHWFYKVFADPSAVSLFFLIAGVVLLIEIFGRLVEPILISIALAYLLDVPVRYLERCHIPFLWAVIFVFSCFLTFIVLFLIWMIPAIWNQLILLMKHLPSYFSLIANNVNQLQAKMPHSFQHFDLMNIVHLVQQKIPLIVNWVLSFSLSAIPNIVEIIVYMIIVPLLILFFMKDKKEICLWFERYSPSHRSLISKVWKDVDYQIGQYIKGRITEVLIVSVVSFIIFSLFGFNYSLILAVSLGISVVIPYVGFILVLIPAIILAFVQWGGGSTFIYFLISFFCISIVDGNILAPILFSETMDLHPVVVILAVLVFGYIYGFWGVFLSSPLAAMVNSILHHWPEYDEKELV